MFNRICQDCGDIKIVADRKTASAIRCNKCQMKYRESNHIRICIDCGERKYVRNSSLASAERCLTCSNSYRAKNKKPIVKVTKVAEPKKTKRRVQAGMTKKAIEAYRKVNEKHRREMAKQKSVELLKTTPEEQSKMIEDFLAGNSPSVVISTQ